MRSTLTELSLTPHGLLVAGNTGESTQKSEFYGTRGFLRMLRPEDGSDRWVPIRGFGALSNVEVSGNDAFVVDGFNHLWGVNLEHGFTWLDRSLHVNPDFPLTRLTALGDEKLVASNARRAVAFDVRVEQIGYEQKFRPPMDVPAQGRLGLFQQILALRKTEGANIWSLLRVIAGNAPAPASDRSIVAGGHLLAPVHENGVPNDHVTWVRVDLDNGVEDGRLVLPRDVAPDEHAAQTGHFTRVLENTVETWVVAHEDSVEEASLNVPFPEVASLGTR